MKIDPKILSGGELEPSWSDPYSKGPLEGLKLLMRFPRVSERRAALLNDDGEPKDEKTVRAFYLSRITDWNVEGQEFTTAGLEALLDLDAGLEGWIVREVQDLARFLGRDGDTAASQASGDPRGGETG